MHTLSQGHCRSRRVGGMATVPGRQALLAHCVGSVINQLDHPHVYLNGHSQIPACLEHPRITPYLSTEHAGDLGDAGEFFQVATESGYYLSLDDDFVYPPDYVERMTAAVGRYAGDYGVGLHGICLHRKVNSYGRDRTVFHWNNDIVNDTPVHILGTGLLCFDVSRFRMSLQDFGSKNMADLWVGLLAQRSRIGMVCLQHDRGWLRALPVRESLYSQMRVDDSGQTTLVNTLDCWRIWGDRSAATTVLPRCLDRFEIPAQRGVYYCENPAVYSREGIVDQEICRACRVRSPASFLSR